MMFFYEKDRRFNARLIHKSRFLIGQIPIEKIWVENSVFAIQYIENRKSFTEVLSPPPVTKLILLHTVVVLHFTHYIKMACLVTGGGGGDAVKMLKNTLL